MPDQPDTDNLIEVRSPYRPYPLGAKRDLQEAVETVVFPDDDPRAAYVSEQPEDTLLNEWELDVQRTDSPVEVWETDRGERIEIYEDRVKQDGREVTIDPSEAKEKTREQDHFSRVDTANED